jgi:hypothetical protein
VPGEVTVPPWVWSSGLSPLRRSLDRNIDYAGPGAKALEGPASKTKTTPLNANADALYSRGRDPLISSVALRPSCARPLCGPRVSSTAWHRLGGLLRGSTTWPRVCTPSPACTSQVLMCLLGAPPTGGIHSVSQTLLTQNCLVQHVT